MAARVGRWFQEGRQANDRRGEGDEAPGTAGAGTRPLWHEWVRKPAQIDFGAAHPARYGA